MTPVSPLGHALGFRQLPPLFYLALVLMAATYLLLVELVKLRFFDVRGEPRLLAEPRRERERRIHRRAFRWSNERELP